MDIKRKIIKNSTVGMLYQIINTFFQFIIRIFIVKYLGEEILGINSTFSSLLNTISLAELGFQTAVVYSLYKPLEKNDKEQINELANIYRYIYQKIGFLFIVISLAVIPFLHVVLKGIEINNVIYLIWILQAMGTASTYFMAYRRAILYADRREYIYKLCDTCFVSVISIIQIIMIIVFKDYIYYLVLNIVKVFLSNAIVNHICIKYYPFLHKERINREIFRSIFNNVKSIFTSKIAGAVNQSANNLIISSLISAIASGKYTNYALISNTLKLISDSITNPISPFIGRMINAVDSNNENSEFVFRIYTFVRFVLAAFIVPAVIIWSSTLISILYGKQYVMSEIVPILFGLDIYIHIIHSASCDYINGMGLFSYAKRIEIKGAVINIIFSVLFAIKLGISGVLLGTLLSQIYFWFSRVKLCYERCFMEETVYKYVKDNIFYGITVALILVSSLLFKIQLNGEMSFTGFIIRVLLSELINLILVILFCARNNYAIILFRYLCTMLKEKK